MDYKTSSFNEIFENDNSVSIHHKTLQSLEMEIHKICNNMSPTISNNVFAARANHYNLRNSVIFKMCLFSIH